MRILVAPERFYPTMKALAVAQAMMRGLQRVSPHYEVDLYPLSSGGAGTTDLAVRLAHGRIYHETIPVFNRRPRDVRWALLPDGTAIFDAQDVLGHPDGPALLTHSYTTSAPLGEMLRRLLDRRPTRIAIGLADALAADGGLGMLTNFGVLARDAAGAALQAGTRHLLGFESIDFAALTPPAVPILALTDRISTWNQRVQETDFRLDLIHGGLTDAACRYVDELGRYIRLPLGDMPGTGAGGGLGVALGFLGAQFMTGAAFLAGLGALKEKVWEADWVLTGSVGLSVLSQEQAVGLVAGLARDAGISAVALTMELGYGHPDLLDSGLVGIYSVLDRPRNERDAHRALAALVEKAAYRVGYWMQALSDP